MFSSMGTWIAKCSKSWKVEQNVEMASKMIGARTVLGRKELTKDTKLRVVTAVVIPTLTYMDVKLGLYRQGTRDTNRLHR